MKTTALSLESRFSFFLPIFLTTLITSAEEMTQDTTYYVTDFDKYCHILILTGILLGHYIWLFLYVCVCVCLHIPLTKQS